MVHPTLNIASGSTCNFCKISVMILQVFAEGFPLEFWWIKPISQTQKPSVATNIMRIKEPEANMSFLANIQMMSFRIRIIT